MNKITLLDRCLSELNRQTSTGNVSTLEDLESKLTIQRPELVGALEYLVQKSYAKKINNAYQVTFEGASQIDKYRLLFRNKPFRFENTYKKIKFTALFLNTIMVLTLGWLNYANAISKNKHQPAKLEISGDTLVILKTTPLMPDTTKRK